MDLDETQASKLCYLNIIFVNFIEIEQLNGYSIFLRVWHIYLAQYGTVGGIFKIILRKEILWRVASWVKDNMYDEFPLGEHLTLVSWTHMIDDSKSISFLLCQR